MPLTPSLTSSPFKLCRKSLPKNNEFLLCTNLYEDGEFVEGVRALLVDKDKAPRWQPDTLEDVTRARVERQFAALADGDALTLRAP